LQDSVDKNWNLIVPCRTNNLTVSTILARIGVADVKSFGLSWEDCDGIMRELGYVLKIDAGLVA
jgi:hypothetical protein